MAQVGAKAVEVYEEVAYLAILWQKKKKRSKSAWNWWALDSFVVFVCFVISATDGLIERESQGIR